MRLMRFNGMAKYAPRKTLAVADTLSRGPEQCYSDRVLHEDVAAHIDVVISQVPATPQKISQRSHGTANDPQLQKVCSFIKSGWPHIENVPEMVKDFY